MTAPPATPHPFGNLEVEAVIGDREAVLWLSGDLDLSSAEIFGDVARRGHAQGIPILVLDLSSLEFIDSSGLRELVVALKRQREIGSDVVLRAPTDHTRRVLEIVGLSEVLTITADTVVLAAHDSGHTSTPAEELVPVDTSRRPPEGSNEASQEAYRS